MKKNRVNDKNFHVSNLSKGDENYLVGLGVSKSLLSKMFSAEIVLGSKNISCLAVKNVLQDYELFDFDGCKPRKLMSSGFIHFGIEGKTTACSVFWSMADFLAYDILCKTSPLSLPCPTDCFVICNPQSFVDAVVETDEYDKIYLFLPNTVFGKTMALTIMGRNGKHAMNCSVYFGQYDNIFDYYKETKKKLKI